MRTKIGIAVLVCALVATGIWLWQRHGQVRPSPVEEGAVEGNPEQSPGSPAPAAPATPQAPQPAAATSFQALSNAPASVRAILDLGHNPLERQTTARALGSNLKRPEVTALYQFLLEKHDEDETQRGHSLKNDLLNILCDQRVVPTDLHQILAQVYRDTKQNVVIRDYAVQHVASLYERLQEPLPWGRDQIESQQQSLRELLWECLAETDSSIAGTALIALSRLAELYPGFDRKRIGEAALVLAQDEQASVLVRVTAVQLCAEMDVKEALPLLVQTAEKASDTTLRISAIGGLGLVGGRPELKLLDRIAREDNPRLERAIALAQRRVQERVGQP